MKHRKIKILQTIRQGKIGGGESHVLDLVRELDKEKFTCVVLSFTEGPMVDQLRADGITTYVIETHRPFDFSVWQRVKAILQKEKIDVVHAHGTRANSNVFFSAKKLGIPLIYTVHGWSFHPDQRFPIRSLRILSERFLVKQANLTICVSENNLKDARSLFKIDRAKVIRAGINLQKFDSMGDYDDLRANSGMDNETVLVGYLVRMTKQKDPFTLIKAIALIPQSLDIKFWFVGDGDLKDDAVALARELNVESKITFMGFRQDVPNILNAIDIYCLPSLWEGLPIGMLEAMAMKKAVVITDIDGAKEVVHHEHNGILIPPMQAAVLAKVLIKLSQDAKFRLSLGVAAGETIRKDFDIGRMTKEIENVYSTILL